MSRRLTILLLALAYSAVFWPVRADLDLPG
jgi:hypothetical protein